MEWRGIMYDLRLDLMKGRKDYGTSRRQLRTSLAQQEGQQGTQAVQGPREGLEHEALSAFVCMKWTVAATVCENSRIRSGCGFLLLRVAGEALVV